MTASGAAKESGAAAEAGIGHSGDFGFEVTHSRDTAVIALCGELDPASAGALSRQCEQLAGECVYLVIDLAGVTFIDSTGVGALVAGMKRCQSRGGELALAGAPPCVLRVLDLTGLAKLFQLYESVPAALDGGVVRP